MGLGKKEKNLFRTPSRCQEYENGVKSPAVLVIDLAKNDCPPRCFTLATTNLLNKPVRYYDNHLQTLLSVKHKLGMPLVERYKIAAYGGPRFQEVIT